jgi:hypothetical protein
MKCCEYDTTHTRVDINNTSFYEYAQKELQQRRRKKFYNLDPQLDEHPGSVQSDIQAGSSHIL